MYNDRKLPTRAQILAEKLEHPDYEYRYEIKNAGQPDEYKRVYTRKVGGIKWYPSFIAFTQLEYDHIGVRDNAYPKLHVTLDENEENGQL